MLEVMVAVMVVMGGGDGDDGGGAEMREHTYETKSALQGHKQRRLPRNLHFKVHKVLRLPRNLHFKVHECLPRNQACVLYLPRNLLFKAHSTGALRFKVIKTPKRSFCWRLPAIIRFLRTSRLRLPRNLDIDSACHEKLISHHRNRFPWRLSRKMCTAPQRERSLEEHLLAPTRFCQPAQSKCASKISC